MFSARAFLLAAIRCGGPRLQQLAVFSLFGQARLFSVGLAPFAQLLAQRVLALPFRFFCLRALGRLMLAAQLLLEQLGGRQRVGLRFAPQ